MSTSFEIARAIRVACVTCAAKPGEPCILPGGAIGPMHKDRIFAAWLSECAVPDPAPPFTAAERADVLAVAAVPPRALRAIADHLTRCAVKHGVEPHVTRPDRDAQAHMAGADRHLLRMARVGEPGYDLDAVDEDSGAPQLVAWASRAMLTLECWLGERERKVGTSS